MTTTGPTGQVRKLARLLFEADCCRVFYISGTRRNSHAEIRIGDHIEERLTPRRVNVLLRRRDFLQILDDRRASDGYRDYTLGATGGVQALEWGACRAAVKPVLKPLLPWSISGPLL